MPSDMIAVSLGLPRRNAVVASPDFLRTHGRPIVPADLYRFRCCIQARLPNNALLFRWRFEKEEAPCTSMSGDRLPSTSRAW